MKDKKIKSKNRSRRLFDQYIHRSFSRTRIAFFLAVITVFTVFYINKRFLNDINYNNPLVVIESIKINDTYSNLTFTMESYANWDKEIIAGFTYKGKKARVKFYFDISNDTLEIQHIGKDSDHLLFAISELFDEPISNTKMKDIVAFSLYRKGDGQKIDLFDEKSEYELSYEPNADDRGSVRLRMTINMELGVIELREKYGGIAKKNLVKAFEEL